MIRVTEHGRAGVKAAALLLLVLALAGCGPGNPEYFFWVQAHGNVVGPFSTEETCEKIRAEVARSYPTLSSCWRGR